MDGSRLARTHRALRVTLRLRQVDVSAKAGVGRWKVVKLEAGEIDDLTARRAVERHAGVLDSALPARSREVRRWLRQPVGELAGIWFLSHVGQANLKRNPSAIRRVRRSSRGTSTHG